MIRNEADIIETFLDQIFALFDESFLVDVQSTDGTREIIDIYKRENDPLDRLHIYNCKTQEKYQSAICNLLSRYAFSRGATWCFLLDADEFIALDSAETLRGKLQAWEGDVLSLPWVNLVPERFGSFGEFDFKQRFFYTNPKIQVTKVAFSSRFAFAHPDFFIDEGNHFISKSRGDLPEEPPALCSLMHIPIRSAERLQYKLRSAARLLKTKETTTLLEGYHVTDILNRLSGSEPDSALLCSIAASYSTNDPWKSDRGEVNTATWTTLSMPDYLNSKPKKFNYSRSLHDVLLHDKEMQWVNLVHSNDMSIGAILEDNEIKIMDQMVMGEKLAHNRFQSLQEFTDYGVLEDLFEERTLLDSIQASCEYNSSIQIKDPSGIAPALFVLFSLARPRRFVSITRGDSVPYEIACIAKQKLYTSTECIAIDNWLLIDDASISLPQFSANMMQAARQHDQYYFKGSIFDAIRYFDDSSIDMLNINCKLFSSEGVVSTLNALSKKLTSNAVVVLTNLRNGVTIPSALNGIPEFWSELSKKHSGLIIGSEVGILCVGPANSAVRSFVERLNNDNSSMSARLLKTVFESLSSLSRNNYYQYLQLNQIHQQDSTDHRKSFLRHIHDTIRDIVINSKYRNVLLPKAKFIKDKLRRAKKYSRTVLSKAWNHTHQFVKFERQPSLSMKRKGLHKDVRLVIPTRGCSKWLNLFLDAYEEFGLKPTYAVDQGCESETLRILRERNIDIIFIDMPQLGNGESIMPYLSQSINEDYIFRLDDDEFPSSKLLDFVNSIPESGYSFVHSWWLPRYEIAFIDGSLKSCHPKHLRTKVGGKIYENLHGGRFFRHKDVVYDKVGPHHGNFISDFVSHAPENALILHLDYLVRTPEERLAKIRSVEARFPGEGWTFANHMIPEFAPRELLRARDFQVGEISTLIGGIMANIYRAPEKLCLSIDEIMMIQNDRLTQNTLHHHY
ncbi:MAG: conserved protein of unknown function [Leptospirillum rubarum]|nr:MAG: conserved protein of unknown function [Leptospirillum rubarum]